MPDATRAFSWRTLLALVLVPVLVAGGFLWGTWNSGDRLHKVQAAIVNLDEGVTLDGQFVPLGRQLSADLVDTDKDQNFTWVLADEAHAWPGLNSGRYAAVVVIPANFSKAATSYGKDDPLEAEQATIAVHTSPVAGVADSVLGNVLANAASRSLNQTLTEAYLDRIYIGFNDTGKQFQTVADGADKLADGADDLSDGVQSAADGATQLSSGLGQLSDNSKGLVSGVRTAQTGAGQLASGLREMTKQTATLPSDGKRLASGVKQYVGEANQLADQLTAAGAGTATLAQNLSTLSAGLTKVQQTMALASENPQVLGVACPYANVPDVGEQLCEAYSNGIRTGTSAADLALRTNPEQPGQPGIQPGLATLSARLNSSLPSAKEQREAAAGLAEFKTAGKKLTSGSAALGSGLGQLRGGIVRAADGATQLAGGLPALTSGVAKYTGGVDQAASGSKELASGLKSATSGSSSLADGARELADGLAKGAKEIPSYSKADRENLSTVVASPVNTGDLQGVSTPTVAWATLLIALALWLGALATYAVVRPLDPRLALSTASTGSLVWRAIRPGVLVAAAQALVLTGLGSYVLALSLPQSAALAGLLLLAGAAFTLVNHALATWLGNLGRLIAITFAVLTTVVAVTAAVPTVFDTLRGLSPVSSALDGVRALVTGASGAPAMVFTLVGWALVGLTATTLAVMRRRSVQLNQVNALA